VSVEFVRAMNRGKAQLENGDAAQAIAAFQQAVSQAPQSAPAMRNLARGYLLAGELEPLADALARAERLEPDSVATHYLRGLMYARQLQFEPAVVDFEAAVRLDPYTATLRFQLANAYQALERHAEASEQLEETLRLDPFHTAARHRLAGYARSEGDREKLMALLSELQRLKNLFGDQGDQGSTGSLEVCRYTLAEPAVTPATRAGALSPLDEPRAVRFVEATREMLPAAPELRAVVVLDLDEGGRYTLFAVGADGSANLLSLDAAGVFQRTRLDVKLSRDVLASDRLVMLSGSIQGSAVDATQDYPVQQLPRDLLLLGSAGAQLLERTGPEAFEDVTRIAGLMGVRGHAARWLDYDHDGDIDLVVANDGGIELWQNGGDGRFEEVSREVGLQSSEPGSEPAQPAAHDVAAADLDNDIAVDLVVARAGLPTLVFENQRTGRFAQQLEPPGPWPAARRVLIDDLDNDGQLDALLVGVGQATVRAGRTETSDARVGGQVGRHIDLAGLDPAAAVLIDFDNDGRLDLFAVGASAGDSQLGRLALWRNAPTGHWPDASQRTGLDGLALPTPTQVLAADLDADGDSDLLLTTPAGLRLLRNDGGSDGGQLKVRLVGTKSNPSGIGTRVEVRAGEFWAVRSVSSLPIEIGLDGNRQLDSLQTVWSNGVVDNQIEFAVTGEPVTVVEKTVDTGSCPFLYAWDGKRFRFVTDLLGNSPLGLSIRRGEVLASDPDEFVWVGDSRSLVPRDGRYVLQVTDELREVVYLDQARLVAVDHAPDVEVHPTDRLMPPPFPVSELWPLRSPRVPRSAVGDDGIDRTRALSAIDGVFAPPGAPLQWSLRGRTHPLTLTLDFGSLAALRAPVLALTGWIRYGDASTNIAASQNASLSLVPTTLEVERADGTWQPVDVVIGAPAGKTKTITVDLAGKLPKDARRLRLRTSFELRWDRIALLERLPADALAIHFAAPQAAQLQWHGFSEIRQRAPHHPTTPDWDTVTQRPPWRTTPQGWVTRYGDVLPLLGERDGRIAILNGGDALRLDFAAADFPPRAAGTTRSFFFYSVGWDKDSDHNVVNGDTVLPLPVVAAPGDSGDSGRDWQLEYNTRWVPQDFPVSRLETSGNP